MGEPPHVCFVCSGNICRSPMAELVFTERLRALGSLDQVRVSSAGIGPWHVGDPIDPRAGATLRAAGYPTKHTAKQLDADQLDADLLLAMDSGHFRELTAHADPDRVRMFRSFDPSGTGEDVPDPYYGGASGFTDLLTCIERCMPGLVEWTSSAR